MSGWIRRALFSNLSLKIVSLVLAVAIYVLVRPAGTGRNGAHPERRRSAAVAWRPDAGTPAAAADSLATPEPATEPEPAPEPEPEPAPERSGAGTGTGTGTGTGAGAGTGAEPEPATEPGPEPEPEREAEAP